jgi:hypothetical protein
MSELEQLVKNTSNMTLDSAIATVRAFKLEAVDNDYESGFNKGIDAAIKAIELFQSALKSQGRKLDD